MPDDEKIANLSDGAFRAYVTAICYSARVLTDGRLPLRKARDFAGRRIVELVPLLWHDNSVASKCSPDCDGGGGLEPEQLRIHNYLRYNPTAEQVLKERAINHEAKVRAGKAGAAARWHSGSNGNGKSIAEHIAQR